MAIGRWLWRTFRKSEQHNPFFFVIENAVGDPYLVRYRLFRCPWFRIFLHHILRSDEDPDLHDHPWKFVSLVLWRGYVEVLPGDVVRRIRAWNVVRHEARDAHRLILDRPAWTMLLVTGEKREWGFHVREGWMPNGKYFDRKYGVGNWISL
jgi:hypothetical protein